MPPTEHTGGTLPEDRGRQLLPISSVVDGAETLRTETLGAETLGTEILGAETHGIETHGTETLGAETHGTDDMQVLCCFIVEVLVCSPKIGAERLQSKRGEGGLRLVLEVGDVADTACIKGDFLSVT